MKRSIGNTSIIVIYFFGLFLFLSSAQVTTAQVTIPTFGVINTLAGTGIAGYGGDGASAINASLNNPNGVALDSAGNIYVADYSNSVVRKITASSGYISTLVGTGVSGFADGSLTTAKLDGPMGVALDASGNLYIADNGNNRIRVVNLTSQVLNIAGVTIQPNSVGTLAGNGIQHYSGENVPATTAELDSPSGVAVDSTGNIYVADSGSSSYRIRVINPSATQAHVVATISIPATYIRTVAGGGTRCSGGDSFGNNCPATQAALNVPSAVAVDSLGNIFIADTSHYEVRKVTATSGLITNVAGSGTGGYNGDGGPATSTSAYLGGPKGVAVDRAFNFYIADSPNNRIRAVNTSSHPFTIAGIQVPAGYIVTVAGSANVCSPPTASCGDTGSAVGAALDYPIGAAVDSNDNIYMGDSRDNRIRIVGGTTVVNVSGGTLSGNGAGLSNPGSSITKYNNLAGSLGTVSFSAGSLISGSLQMGGTFNGGGTAIVTTNGTAGTYNGADFSGYFSGTVNWKLMTLADGTHQYTLTGTVVDTIGHSGTLSFGVNTGKGFYNGTGTGTGSVTF